MIHRPMAMAHRFGILQRTRKVSLSGTTGIDNLFALCKVRGDRSR